MRATTTHGSIKSELKKKEGKKKGYNSVSSGLPFMVILWAESLTHRVLRDLPQPVWCRSFLVLAGGGGLAMQAKSLTTAQIRSRQRPG